MNFKLQHKATIGADINRRSAGFYHVLFQTPYGGGYITIQGNPFGSCGINLLCGWESLWGGTEKDIPPFFELLRAFGDGVEQGKLDGTGSYRAKRYLIQTTASQINAGGFLSHVLKHCSLLTEYENLSHSSSKQFLYMLELK